MSYAAPNIVLLTNPVGIDAVVQGIQQNLYAGLPWLTHSFGRAYELKDVEMTRKVKSDRIPKVFIGVDEFGNGEYLDVRPNDFLQAYSFIAVRGPEARIEYNQFGTDILQRNLSIIFWFNLERINPDKKYIFTEELKIEAEKVLKKCSYVTNISEMIDERVEDVFDAFELRTVWYAEDDDKQQYLMYPYAGFRFNLEVTYPEQVPCLPMSFNMVTNFEQSFDIEFKTVEGQTQFQDPRLVGRKIRLTRMGVTQYDTGTSMYWNFDATTGTITFAPAASQDEEFSVQVYGYSAV